MRTRTKPAQPAEERSPLSAASTARWLLLIHQIPPKPDYLRVKIGRRLQRVGAVAIKNSVYILPPTTDCFEDFQWIVREIEAAGGEAFISEASLMGEGLTDDDVRARFNSARGEEYQEIRAEGQSLLKAVKRPNPNETDRKVAEHELAKLRRRYEIVNAIDFFEALDGSSVAALLSDVQQEIELRRGSRQSADRSRLVNGATWVTRRDVHVDRIASAWLIRRFIDRRPRFRFVDPKHYEHVKGELRFDMFEAEYTHVGDACTFETLMSEFVPKDEGLRELAEIVHDVDCKDAKFRRDEAAGVARTIDGIAKLCDRDEDRVERGRALFDELYAAFSGGAARA